MPSSVLLQTVHVTLYCPVIVGVWDWPKAICCVRASINLSDKGRYNISHYYRIHIFLLDIFSDGFSYRT